MMYKNFIFCKIYWVCFFLVILVKGSDCFGCKFEKVDEMEVNGRLNVELFVVLINLKYVVLFVSLDIIDFV